MYSVFLVEDEYVIREGIKQLVEWERHGFKFVGEASDGELAWPLIQKHKPDIVITDIKMPFIDGLEMSRMIKKDLPGTIIIILSGHDDFEYAQEAISIGASQYLLKPLSKNQLIEVLKKVKKQKDEEENQSRYNGQFNREVQEYLTASRRGLFEMLTSGSVPVTQLLERASGLNIDLVAERYNIILFFLEENLMHPKYTAEIAKVQERINTHCTENPSQLLFSIGLEIYAVLVKSDAANIENQTKACTNQLVHILGSLNQTVRWSLLVGQPVARLSAVPSCYRDARRTFFRNRHSVVNQVVYVKGEGTEHVQKPGAIVDFNPNEMNPGKLDQRIIFKFLKNGLQEDVNDFTDVFFEGTGRKGDTSLLFRQFLVINVQFTVCAFLEELGYEKPGALLEKEIKFEEAIGSGAKYCEYIVQMLSEAIALRDNGVKNRYSKMIENAMAYMQKNFDDSDIGLNSVAKIANISPTYFSSVFSQQVGKTFVEYLTELRIGKSKELLRCTNESSSEIAAKVGYNDPHYFSFLFKKVNGCSPRAYRKGKKAQHDA